MSLLCDVCGGLASVCVGQLPRSHRPVIGAALYSVGLTVDPGGTTWTHKPTHGHLSPGSCDPPSHTMLVSNNSRLAAVTRSLPCCLFPGIVSASFPGIREWKMSRISWCQGSGSPGMHTLSVTLATRSSSVCVYVSDLCIIST